MDRDSHLEKLEAELQLWNAEAELWESRAQLAQARLRVRCNHQIDQLREVCRRAERELYRVRSVSGGARWQEIERGAEHAWGELRRSFEQAREEFDSLADTSGVALSEKT